MLRDLFEYLFRGAIQKRVDSRIEAWVHALHTIVRNRRTELLRVRPDDTMNLLINALEEAEERRNKYATLLWELVHETGLAKDAEKLEAIKRRVAGFDPYRPY